MKPNDGEYYIVRTPENHRRGFYLHAGSKGRSPSWNERVYAGPYFRKGEAQAYLEEVQMVCQILEE